ncbi:protein of unknown function [Vibrio tapetis subsp. tapetis]|uniref:Uncharacterized protein n=1 Tax=Vibrio tapetis subsp. tapetis TaxID=1671868 RepID=A0A2N8ZFI9_9VIBR|nr:protein of unknown function [Vibrio tapetis subsp. tapetis]
MTPLCGYYSPHFILYKFDLYYGNEVTRLLMNLFTRFFIYLRQNDRTLKQHYQWLSILIVIT